VKPDLVVSKVWHHGAPTIDLQPAVATALLALQRLAPSRNA
jgi:hypothetical protein